MLLMLFLAPVIVLTVPSGHTEEGVVVAVGFCLALIFVVLLVGGQRPWHGAYWWCLGVF